jgi:hypothetical protein
MAFSPSGRTLQGRFANRSYSSANLLKAIYGTLAASKRGGDRFQVIG